MVTYSEAGVDIEAGNMFVNWLKSQNSSIGGFSGLYPIGDQYLVASTDGVGTKLRIAQDMKLHGGIGIDLVAMCVNDIICCGAKPLFFLDYLAMGKLEQEIAKEILIGIMEGCRYSGCSLLGGETAEMPGCYGKDEYDIAGFSVGIVDKDKLIDGKKIVPGDLLIGLPSSGLHSNGFSLVRRIIEERALDLGDLVTEEYSLGELLMAPTRIYVPEVLEAAQKGLIKGMSHITGGGLPENTQRMMPEGCCACVTPSQWTTAPVFEFLINEGRVSFEEALNVFNLGIGFVLACDETVLPEIKKCFPDSKVIGTVVKGSTFQWSS